MDLIAAMAESGQVEKLPADRPEESREEVTAFQLEN